MVSLTGFRYEESNGAYVKNKVKGGKTPYGAVAGGNGTFIMAGDPPQVIFGIKIDSKKTFKDMYSIIKHNSSRRITKKYCLQIYENLKDASYNSIRDLEKAIIDNCK